jgi:hypothetical protein
MTFAKHENRENLILRNSRKFRETRGIFASFVFRENPEYSFVKNPSLEYAIETFEFSCMLWRFDWKIIENNVYSIKALNNISLSWVFQEIVEFNLCFYLYFKTYLF